MRFVPLLVFLLAAAGDNQQLIKGGVAEGLKRSPDRYLAAVAEFDGEVICEGESCWTPMRILNVLATRGTTVVAGSSINVATSKEAEGAPRETRQMVFMAAPIPEHEHLFGMTAAAVGHDEADVCAVVAALREAGQTITAGAPDCR